MLQPEPMFSRKLSLLFLLFLTCFFSKAATFTVTSNADSGPGTLRQALLDAAANGSAVKDYIHFNIADQSEAGRTITFSTGLPNLTSNLVIDATTQMGNKIGISSAKVIFKTFRSQVDLTLFTGINIEQVEFYGIYFFDTTNPCISDPDGAPRTTIKITDSKNIILGDQAKGNVFNGYKYAVLDFNNVDGVDLADNIFGQSPYAFEAICSGGLSLVKCNNINVGGINKTNTIICGLSIRLNYVAGKTVNINITNNLIGLYSDGITTNHSLDGSYITISGVLQDLTSPKSNVSILFRDNLMTHYGGQGGIVLTGLSGKVDFKHNWFGIDKTGTIALNLKRAHRGDGTALLLYSVDADVVIGDEDPKEGNSIGYTYIGISNYDSRNVKIYRNSFKCIGFREYTSSGNFTIPTIEIINTNAQHVNGIATPNAQVDLFTSDDCVNCSPETYIGTTNANADGNWQFSFTQQYSRSIVANAHVGKQSSLFTKPAINVTKLAVTNFDCGHSGKISGITITNAEKVRWVNEAGNIVSTELELKNAQPGRYKLIVGEYCTVESEFITIQDLTPSIYAPYVNKTQPGCNSNDGSIQNIFAFVADGSLATYQWTDQNGRIVGQTANVFNLSSGSYTLKAFNKAGCFSTYGPVILTPSTAPQISTTSPTIINTLCGQAAGSVTGLEINGGTGTLAYIWKNATGVQVSTSKDLTNKPAGTYTLTVTDGSGCTAVSPPFTIQETDGITLNDNGQITQPDCNGTTGGVTGITAPGATIFRWINTANNQIVGNALNITGLSPGSYKLEASNANGCSQTSKVFIINSPTNEEVYGGITRVLVNATCGLNNGSITATFQDASAQRPKSVRWVNQTTGQTVGTGMAIANLDAGSYGLYATGQNGCEKLIITYRVVRTTAFTVNMGAVLKRDEECGLRNGSITGITASAANVTFTWTDKSTGQVVGSAANLSGMPAGTYVLTVTDGQCPQTLPEFVINNVDTPVPMPAVADMQLCSSGDALITVISASNTISGYSYRLYEDATSTVPLITESTGKFKVNVVNPRSYFISQFKGNCESARAEVKISLGLSALNIANIFTPNGDGINDFWKINSIENYPNALVQVFNRNGTKVFESRGYARRFDGSYQGQPLPTGAYYYIINLNTGCNLLSGSLTLVR